MSYNGPLPQVVKAGGTGDASFTAYSVVCGGTTSTGNLQNVSGVGSSGQVLTSNGSSALPTWQATSSSGGLVLIQTKTASNSASLTFTTGITSTYNNYMMTFQNVVPVTNNINTILRCSTDGGSTYLNSGYVTGNTKVEYNSTTFGNGTTTSDFLNLPGLDNTAGIGLSGTIYLYGLPGAGYKMVQGQFILNEGGNPFYVYVVSWNTTASAVNALQVITSSGNISTGNVSLYGLSN
jgi:hypothetical protein